MEIKIGNMEFRTDLAVECHECYENTEVDGVVVTSSFYENNDIKVTKVFVKDELGESMLGKPKGNYVTIESEKLKNGEVNIHHKVIEIFINELKDMFDFSTAKSILVVGLGNLYVTPDSLGQKVVQKLLVTRHYYDEIKNQFGGIANVCAICPGVMGQTGIETSTIIKSVADEVCADVVIAIDALCARNIDRLNQTIQISDTGISPGGGVNNNRKVLNEKYIGAKVISIGIPTVIDSKTLVYDAFMSTFGEENNNNGKIFLSSSEKSDIILDVLENQRVDMFVSTKEIDELIVRLSGIIARGLNRALHNDLSDEDITCLLY